MGEHFLTFKKAKLGKLIHCEHTEFWAPLEWLNFLPSLSKGEANNLSEKIISAACIITYDHRLEKGHRELNWEFHFHQLSLHHEELTLTPVHKTHADLGQTHKRKYPWDDKETNEWTFPSTTPP